MNKIWIVAGLAALVVAGGLAYAAPRNSGTQTAEAVEASTRFTVANMTCATCPISVKNAMMRVDGVKSVDIDFVTKIAEVVYDPAVTTPEVIAAASTDVGYPAVEDS
jgi:mercuric ion binding protein